MVKQSCALVVDITETVIPNRQELLAFRDNQRARFGAIRFEERGGGLIGVVSKADFVKAERMFGRKQVCRARKI